MARVLVVDDEVELAELVRFNLAAEGFEVDVAVDCASALERIRAAPPDLVVLDVMLPDGSGVDLCRRLRRDEATRNVPVMMLTARGEEHDRVSGFEVGADDYVTKPFSVRELVLRVQAVLRRGLRPDDEGVLEMGRIRLDVAAHRCTVLGGEVALTPIEFRLLEYLVRRRGRVCPRQQILADLWGVGAGESRTLDMHVLRLREKLGQARGQLETVRGVGLRLNDV